MSSCDGVSGSANCSFTCPKGGSWFVCQNEPYFVGCCSSEPCANSGCPDVYPASFNHSVANEILPNVCISRPTTDWYTCNTTSPTFLGCCKSNPCGDGCPADDLLPAAWSSSAVGQLDLFLDGASSPSTASAGSSGISSGAIAGIVVGCVAGLCAIFAVLFFFRRRRKHKKSSHDSTAYHAHMSSYQDSYIGSPDPSVKYASGSSAGFTLPSSPPFSPNSVRGISEIYSKSDDQAHSDQDRRVSVMPTAEQVITELDVDQTPRRTEVYELDGGNH
ncbi:hypothetical protein ASPWEDRAFT_68031 [Aspergillus wentii DTO 134E9]|uniref:Uncharacterized protein n=1 Tax=Aspergillus wentii DTO 134E9 TaxID=1073089 RepID=A0A1L9RSJ4_ASPWE|nr:uncharacterized protein ASPWEDRAFT_68031 [Aspergillus wentii DTO 134E9]OJJ37900.1 hypothetical protein ASPWEDRAFT_68031 [Aspergillus wentii DTO 134E9]